MRWFVLVLLACSSRVDRTGDPAIGRYTGDNKHVFELRPDGTLDIDPITDRTCQDDPALAACRARQTWSRTGTTITFERGALARPLDPTGLSTPHACECHLEREQLQLRGTDLVVGTEHAVRVQ